MDEYEVIYLDDDERNAVRDNRRTRHQGRRRTGDRSIVVPASNRPTVIRHHGRSEGGDAYADRPAAAQVVVQPAPRSGLAGISTGELIELAAQLLAAIQPLPGAPSSQGHVQTDVDNLVTYQTALATHAKRDEQLRTLGGLVGRLLR